jgi:hypothetical protein
MGNPQAMQGSQGVQGEEKKQKIKVTEWLVDDELG